MNIKDFNFIQGNIAKNTFIGILDPKTDNIVPLREWWYKSQRERAQFVVVINMATGHGIIIAKHKEKAHANFQDSQFLSGLIDIKTNTTDKYIDFHCPSRRDCVLIDDALFAGLDDAFRMIEGDTIGLSWIWTSDEDPESGKRNAYVFDAEHGCFIPNNKQCMFEIRSVASFTLNSL